MTISKSESCPNSIPREGQIWKTRWTVLAAPVLKAIWEWTVSRPRPPKLTTLAWIERCRLWAKLWVKKAIWERHRSEITLRMPPYNNHKVSLSLSLRRSRFGQDSRRLQQLKLPRAIKDSIAHLTSCQAVQWHRNRICSSAKACFKG